jgi:hypothetical protein
MRVADCASLSAIAARDQRCGPASARTGRSQKTLPEAKLAVVVLNVSAAVLIVIERGVSPFAILFLAAGA